MLLDQHGPAWMSSAEAARPIPVDEDDREDTTVGEVPEGLLALSSHQDESTRAYTAPQELIELAKRQREERRLARGRAPRAAGSPDGASPNRSAQARSVEPEPDASAPAVMRPSNPTDRATAPAPQPSLHPLDRHSAPPSEPEPGFVGDSAPPVSRSAAEQYAAALDGEPLLGAEASDASARSVRQLAPAFARDALAPVAMPPSGMQAMPFASGPMSSPPSTLSSFKTPWLSRGRLWAMLAGVMALVGYVLASWLAT
jgi:hypothetical protein